MELNEVNLVNFSKEKRFKFYKIFSQIIFWKFVNHFSVRVIQRMLTCLYKNTNFWNSKEGILDF